DCLMSAGDTLYVYDTDGFLERKTDSSGDTVYDYSSRGELLSVTLPDSTFIEYVHDPLGRRIAKKKNSVIVEKYLWQGRTRLLAVYDKDDNLLMRFEYANGRMPVSMTADGYVYYLIYDQVGSLRIVTDMSGTVVKKVDYDTFGNIIPPDTNPAFEVPFGFAGGLHDRDTGLVRFGYRDYDPDVGRWTAKDPIGFAGGNSDLFGYCMNNPVNLTDPKGLKTLYESTLKVRLDDGTEVKLEEFSPAIYYYTDDEGVQHFYSWDDIKDKVEPTVCDDETEPDEPDEPEEPEEDTDELIDPFPEGEPNEDSIIAAEKEILEMVKRELAETGTEFVIIINDPRLKISDYQ
ncbi:MAG: RHS repeat-associated core domain-containing protein, partial [Desulfobacterales bacterium]|nr:RHS repeat-associated core domain-containing protein [Desulfobacterales bacterium]